MYKKLYLLIVWIFIPLLLAASLWVITVSYDGIVQDMLVLLKRAQLEDIIRQRVFPPAKFRLVRVVAWIFILLLPGIAWGLVCYGEALRGRVYLWFNHFKAALYLVVKVFKSAPRSSKFLLLIFFGLVLARSVYYMLAWDLQYDEMWSYNYFTSQPWFASCFMYNNYPLYEWCTGVFKWLPFSMKVNLRLPGLLAGLASMAVLYACVRRYTNSVIAGWASIVLFACMPVTTFYMLYARGVMLELFFAIVGLFSLLFWRRYNPELQRVQALFQPVAARLPGQVRKRAEGAGQWYLVLYIFSNILGCYAMPTHVYAWGVLGVTGLITTWSFPKARRSFLLANVWIGVGVLFCYAPMALGSGFSFATDALVQSRGTGKIMHVLKFWRQELAVFFTGIRSGGGILLLGLILLSVSRKNKGFRLLVGILAGWWIVPIVAFLLQGVVIPPRAWSFSALVIPLTGVLLIQWLAEWKKWVAVGMMVISGAALALLSHRHIFLNWSRDMDRQTVVLADLLMEHGVVTCYDNCHRGEFIYYYPGIEYYYRQRGQRIAFEVADAASLRYKPFVPSVGYDVVVEELDDPDAWAGGAYRLLMTDSVAHFKIVIKK